MPDLIAISQGLGALKALSDIAKVMVGLRDSAKLLETTVEFNQQLLSVQSALLEAQKEQTTLVLTISKLEEEITRFEAWDAEKNKYELKAVGVGAFAYMLKPGARGGNPPHWLCTRCYENRKPSIMQCFGSLSDFTVYKCPQCSAQFRIDGDHSPRWID